MLPGENSECERTHRLLDNCDIIKGNRLDLKGVARVIRVARQSAPRTEMPIIAGPVNCRIVGHNGQELVRQAYPACALLASSRRLQRFQEVNATACEEQRARSGYQHAISNSIRIETALVIAGKTTIQTYSAATNWIASLRSQ